MQSFLLVLLLLPAAHLQQHDLLHAGGLEVQALLGGRCLLLHLLPLACAFAVANLSAPLKGCTGRLG